jgi:hypothetical protein
MLPSTLWACCGPTGILRRFHGENLEKIRIEQHTFMGSVWVAAWLFTIGFLQLSFWKGVLAVVL